MLNGVTPLLVQNITQYPQAAALDTGQPHAGVVRAQDGALAAAVGNILIPLEDGSGLLPGQRITVQVAALKTGLQITITPAASSATGSTLAPAHAPTASGSPPLNRILLPLLESLGKLDQAQRITGVLPRSLPATEAGLRPLVLLLFSGRALGRDIQQLQQLAGRAAARGVLTPDLAGAVAQWLGLAPGEGSEAWRLMLLRARAEQAAAARIAQSLHSEGAHGAFAALKASGAALMNRLLSDRALLQWLREEGELEPFKALAQRFQERTTGADLQNLRSLDHAYQFLDIPVSETRGFLRAQIHTFQDEAGSGRPGGAAIHRAVLDLETTRLGALWVALQSSGQQCACRFRAEDPGIVSILEREAPVLREALAAAGYPDASITASLWDGNREEALVALLSPYQKLDLEV